MKKNKTSKTVTIILPFLLCMLIMACRQPAMEDQPKLETHEASDFFSDGQAARPAVPGTVSRAESLEVRPEHNPLPITLELLEHGRERYGIHCTPCHGLIGDGTGMIVQRGFPRPPTYHSERLRNAADSHFYDVITQGYGVMYAYADHIKPEDRWAIIAYIRALQLSQHAQPQDQPQDHTHLQDRETSP